MPKLPHLLLAAIGCFIVFILWFVISIVPILVIEANYQFKQALKAVFKTTDLRTIFVPNFAYDITGIQSTHQANGIYIPAIDIDEPVIPNVDPNNQKTYTAALKKGIAHAAGTGLPGSGTLGYYFAHSSAPAFVAQYNAVFYLLGKLNEGDTIYIWHQQQKYTYTVTKKSITNPTDLSFLTAAYPAETIVLQTCWPPGTSAKRLLVFAAKNP